METPADLLAPGGAVGAFVLLLRWLLTRGDQLQRENIAELKRQLDAYVVRTDAAEDRADTAENLVTQYRIRFGELDKDKFESGDP